MQFKNNISETDISFQEEQGCCKLFSQDVISFKSTNIKKQKQITKKHKRRPFTLAEDQLLLLQIIRFGKRFEAIARNFPKRSKHELKNRYYTDLRDKENEIFQPNSCYYVPDKQCHKKKSQDVSYPTVCISLENSQLENEEKEILRKFVTNLSNVFTQLTSIKF